MNITINVDKKTVNINGEKYQLITQGKKHSNTKTTYQYLNELPEPYKKLALDSYNGLNYIAYNMQDAINAGIFWLLSPQGYDFWNDVHGYYEGRLKKLPVIPKIKKMKN